MSKPILCVDFDGVIHSYTSGWQGAGAIYDPPVKGAIAWLIRAREHFRVNIFSSRSCYPEGRSCYPEGLRAMKKYLWNFAAHEFGDMEKAEQFVADLSFPTEKPPAFLSIDDRAIRFEGDWADPALAPEVLLQFKPWNQRG